MLQPLEAEGFRTLHDRRVRGPGGADVSIDHVVIGPPGVYAIQSKPYKGPPRVKGRVIWASGRSQGEWYHRARRAAEAVSYALYDELGRLESSVTPIICAHKVELPLFGSTIEGVAIVTAADLVALLRRDPYFLTADRVKWLADLADERLPPAESRSPARGAR
jgi:hypothetical protein